MDDGDQSKTRKCCNAVKKLAFVEVRKSSGGISLRLRSSKKDEELSSSKMKSEKNLHLELLEWMLLRRISLMLSRVIYFEFLGVPEFMHHFVESFTSFVDQSAKKIVFCCKRIIEYETCVKYSFSNCHFGSIKVETSVLFKVDYFLFYFADIV